jgi:hypothetical protein
MGAWPDWWPANPIGSAYDTYQENQKAWNFAFYAGVGLVAVLILLYVYWKVK